MPITSTAPARAKGWKKNTADRTHGRAIHRFGATGELLLDTPDLTPFRVGRYFQLQANSCVSFAGKRCLNLAHRSHAQPDDPPPPEAAARFGYWIGRMQEWKGLPPAAVPKLLDQGTEPGLYADALRERGFCKESDFPYSDDPKALAEQPSDETFIKAYSQKDLETYLIDGSFEDIINGTNLALRSKSPPMFGTHVDRPFENWTGGAPIDSFDSSSYAGDHMLTVLKLDMEARVVIFDNWWDEWGMPDGTGVMTFARYASAAVSDRIAFKVAPFFKENP